MRFFLFSFALVVSGCVPELPQCDLDAALSVAFLDTGIAASDDNGMPMYAGQAIVASSCGGTGRCHASTARGDGRQGAPAGLDFDVGPRCVDALCDASPDRFSHAYESVLSHARLVHGSIERGTMPPGQAGASIEGTNGTFYMLDDDARARIRAGSNLSGVGRQLPTIDHADGRAIVANWLACGAPVVELAVTPQGSDPGTPCAYSGDVGACVHRLLVPLEPPEPTFQSIYDLYLRPTCAGCHGEGASDRRADSMLDFSTPDIAYESLLADAQGESCAGMGARVVPMSSATSLLIDKLSASPSCGDPMAGQRGAPSAVVSAIRTWIDRGALR